jgi:hypothetical protein
MYDGQRIMGYEWAQQGLNLRPIDYESTALTAELWAPVNAVYCNTSRLT